MRSVAYTDLQLSFLDFFVSRSVIIFCGGLDHRRSFMLRCLALDNYACMVVLACWSMHNMLEMDVINDLYDLASGSL